MRVGCNFLAADRHQILGPEAVVIDAAGLDDEGARLAVNAAGVAEREREQAGCGEVRVGLGDLLAQFHVDHAAMIPV